MSDTTSTPILEALQRALTEPEGLPLLTGKSGPGLFAPGAAGKSAAQQARAAGWVDVRRAETKGKAVVEFFALTEKGLTHLLEQTSPRPVLEALTTAIQNCERRVETWIAEVEKNRGCLDGLKRSAEAVLAHLKQPEATLPPWARNGHALDPQSRILDLLRSWHDQGKIGDYPLPDLYEQLRKLTLGQFHDALRGLHEQRRIYLHPWTGPLHELPKPPYSLLVGHEIAYYASLR